MRPIIDTGHGYNTHGKRSEGFFDGNGRVLLKENSVNEAVGNKLSFLFWQNNDEAHFISNECCDISLSERVGRERILASNNTMFISIHADAFHLKDQAKGGRFFIDLNQEGKLLRN